jgi:predicted PurR-regulated permease PerM
MATGQAQSNKRPLPRPALREEALPVERLLGFVLLALLAVATFIILRPFISALLWAVIITYSTSGLYRRLHYWLNGHRSFAAILSTLFVGTVIVLPLVGVSATLTENMTGLAATIREALDRGIGPPPAWLRELPLVGPPLQDHWKAMAAGETSFTASLKPYLSVAGSWLLSGLASIGGGILELLLSLVIAFFLYRDGGIAAACLYALSSRIGNERATRALDVAGGTIKGVVYGIVGTNLIQGVLSGLGFWFAGVPGAFLLGFLCFFLTMIPLAPTFVWLPACLWLFYKGSTATAIALAVWSFLIFNPLENVLRPYLISRGSNLPILLILLGMLGGLATFGLLGIFVGPTILAVGYGLVTEWIEPSGQSPDSVSDTRSTRADL